MTTIDNKFKPWTESIQICNHRLDSVHSVVTNLYLIKFKQVNKNADRQANIFGVLQNKFVGSRGSFGEAIYRPSFDITSNKNILLQSENVSA